MSLSQVPDLKTGRSALVALFLLVFALNPIHAADPFIVNTRLGRGINLGNALEAPREGEWGVTLDQAWFPLIKQKGFAHVRIPVRWSTPQRTGMHPPYTIDSAFLARVEWAVKQALSNRLCAVVNVHHYDTLFADPDGQRARFLAIWKQVSAEFKNYSDSLVFEILNEPHGNLTPEKWNALLSDAIGVIRIDNPQRTVVVGTADWGGVGALGKLVLPANERNLILTIHYYNPFRFTHQGAEWVDNSTPWLGTAWNATTCEKIAVIQDIEEVRAYALKNNLPVYIGEFGAYSKADMDSRIRWTSYCARLFERYGFSWAYWEFCSGFGIYDAQTKQFRPGLVDALISDDTTILGFSGGLDGVNILSNGDFSAGTTDWAFGVWSATGAATAAVDHGAFHAIVTALPPDPWNIQLIQKGLRLEKNQQYAIFFDAWTDVGERPISVSVMNSTDYTGYGGMDQTISTAKRTFTTCFPMQSDRADGMIAFSFGAALGGVRIDNVRLVKLQSGVRTRMIPNTRPVMGGEKRRFVRIQAEKETGEQPLLFSARGQIEKKPSGSGVTIQSSGRRRAGSISASTPTSSWNVLP